MASRLLRNGSAGRSTKPTGSVAVGVKNESFLGE